MVTPASPQSIAFSRRVVELIDASQLSEAEAARVLIVAALALCDRMQLHENGKLCDADVFESFCMLSFGQLRTTTGNAAPPAGGVQA